MLFHREGSDTAALPSSHEICHECLLCVVSWGMVWGLSRSVLK